MAVPKKKMSKSRTRRRKATHKISKPHFVVDPETGVAKKSHRVNPVDCLLYTSPSPRDS